MRTRQSNHFQIFAVCAASVVLAFAQLCIAQEEEASGLEVEIAALQRELIEAGEASSSIRKRRAYKNVARSGEDLLEKSTGVAERFRVLGVIFQGQKRLLAIEDGVREATQSWREVLLSLKSCGMNAPKQVIGEGAMGFWAAMDEVYPEARQQRCWQHKTMNVLNCLAKLFQPKAKAAIHNIWQAENKVDAEKAFNLFIDTYEPKYPKAA